VVQRSTPHPVQDEVIPRAQKTLGQSRLLGCAACRADLMPFWEIAVVPEGDSRPKRKMVNGPLFFVHEFQTVSLFWM